MSRDRSVAEVDAATAMERLAAGAVLVDVREDDEWAAGHAPGAVHMPLGALDREVSQFARDTVLAVCRSGARSSHAAKVLRDAGVEVEVAGGMSAWAATGLPVVRDDGSPGSPGSVV